MMKYCILIAGMPATGKSRFAQWLSKEIGIPYVSKDSVKEILFDTLGFKSRNEKILLGEAARDICYYFVENQMRVGRTFILENNYEDSSKEGIQNLLQQYDYTPITVLFDGDINVIYKRFLERENSPERHRGHIVNTVYPETGEKHPYIPLSLEQFSSGMENRGFRRFSVGGIKITVDCTDFASVNYLEILCKINEKIQVKRLP